MCQILIDFKYSFEVLPSFLCLTVGRECLRKMDKGTQVRRIRCNRVSVAIDRLVKLVLSLKNVAKIVPCGSMCWVECNRTIQATLGFLNFLVF